MSGKTIIEGRKDAIAGRVVAVNLPFDRVPICPCDRGGEPLSKWQMMGVVYRRKELRC